MEPQNSYICSPRDCVLLIGVPIDMEDFDKFRSGKLQSDFLDSFPTTRLNFFKEVYRPTQEILPKIKRYGCRIIRRANRADLERVFQDYNVVIIFTHWNDDHIEINGEMIPNNEFSSFIPANFKGLIDLSACQPEETLVVSIKNRAPEATVKCVLTTITPSYTLEIIRLTLHLLRKFKMDYRNASSIVLQQIIKKKQSNEKPE